MRNFVVGCIVLIATARTAFSETKEPPKKLAVDLGDGVKMEMVLVPPGEFKMGSGESPEETAAFFKKNYGVGSVIGSLKDEHAQHRVRINKPFYLGTYVFTAPVGKFKPNAFGLYDMHGNASQWCADWYGEDYYGKSPADDPKGPGAGDTHVIRGSSWDSSPDVALSARRAWGAGRIGGLGFRVARSLQ